ncbi:unnamed protein product [Pseudo-nitzschia multistriata]|uniref:Replication termination factor 2 n=1 Tax=Pseudo-nitzschia multistriata TaxID=183589 RepID=A0A448ZSK1_9STRA|nr:unnamed protein product [Pseudo-nitzschia multistriata]
MGGDGGVIASNRKFMRGAGTADCVGDLHRKAAQKFNPKEAMSTCSLTKTPLLVRASSGSSSSSSSQGAIVADPYGVLYHKEAAVRALLKRAQKRGYGDDAGNDASIGPQVRRLADLYEVRFHLDGETPVCPISGKALNGSIPALLLVPGKQGAPNVVSESTLSRLSQEELEAEFGAIAKKVRLAPDPLLLEQIKEEVRTEQEKDEEERFRAKKEKRSKKDKSSKRKRGSKESGETKKKRDKGSGHKECPPLPSATHKISSSSSSSLGQQVQQKVNSAIQQNSVLSSLFTNKNASSKVTEKEKKDNLFAR